MMMAQPFPAHQGIPQHGLPPGHHPMAAQHPNAGHPGAGMVQQMHPGVSAPGGPQVSQAGPMMGGMPPGAGGTAGPGGPMPNAHALSHLNPAQAHAFPQQIFPQNFGNNPNLLQQQQQQFLRQRMLMQQQHHQQQQQHGAGLPVTMPNGTQGMSPAHMAAMQGNPNVRPMGMQMHLQQGMPHGQPQGMTQQQFLALQQAQQQAQAQQVQANNGQPGQHTPQRASAQPPSMHEAQAGTPQSQHGGPPQSGTPQPKQPSQPPSTQPPQSQSGPPQSQATPNPQPQQLPPSQQPGQQPGQQQQTPQGAQGQQGQSSGPANQQAMQEAQMKSQQQQNAALMMQQQQQRMRQGQSILVLNGYAELLSQFQPRDEATDLLYWQSFVDRFYTSGGSLRQGVWNPHVGSKQFEISTPALARYYMTQFTSGIRNIQMVVEAARERESPNGGHIVESHKTSFIYWFTNDCQLFTKGTLRAHFDMSNKIEMLDINITSHDEFVPRSLLQSLEASEQKQSPKVSKNNAKRGQKQGQSISIPESMVTSNGVPTPVMGFLEVAETISQMQMLFSYSQSHPGMSPPEALRDLVNTLQHQGPLPGGFPAGMNPGMQQMPNARAPSINGPSQFASPGMAHLGLPGAQGSPHLTGSAHASPAQSHLAGPPGMQGGVHPSPVGVNNSPNVGGNKRRRASTVKMEDETGSGEINGTSAPGSGKVKASPRVPKRQKGAAA